MAEWNWKFRGYQTSMGVCPVQDWYNDLPEEAGNECHDTFLYLQHLPRELWKAPQFDPLPGETVSEIKFATGSHWFRIYGYFGPEGERQSFVLLNGRHKKVKNDRHSKKEAARRRKKIERKESTIHEFQFDQRDDKEIAGGETSPIPIR